MLAEFENPKFRATGAAAEQDAARDSFAFSTVWAGEVAAESADGRMLVEVSSFLPAIPAIRRALAAGRRGELRLSPDLSVADPSTVKVFPENIEFAARETFTATSPGPRSPTSRPNRSRSP